MTDTAARVWLTDCIERVNPFRPDITHLFLKRDEKGLCALAKPAANNTVNYVAYPKEDHPIFAHSACFGNLGYLRTILTDTAIKDSGKMDVEFQQELNGDGQYASVLKFAAKRSRYKYGATAPSVILPASRPRIPKDAKWTYETDLTKEAIDDFTNAMRVSTATEDKEKLFTLTYQDGVLKAALGRREHSTEVELSGAVRAIDPSMAVQTLLDAAQFRAVLKECGAGGKLYATTTGVKVTGENVYSSFSYLMIGKKRESLL